MPGPLKAAYQDPGSLQTLAAGLDEYYALNAARITRPDDLPPESAALFRSHDICHVIFGLSTSLEDETVADMRTVIGCDVGFLRYARYLSTDQQAKALFAELGWSRAAMASVSALPRGFRALLQRLRAPKPWPWSPPAGFMDRTLADLRREFGIRPV